MKKKIGTMIKQYPILEKWSRIILNRRKTEKLRPQKKISGKNNKFKVDHSVILNNCIYDIVGDNNEIIIQKSSILNNVTFFIRGNNNKILISNNVRFNKAGIIWIEDYKCSVNIGEFSSFEDIHIAATEPNSGIDIGSDCMFAYDIDIRTGDSHSIINSETHERINYAENIHIGNHVWVTSHVSILKGVKISDNSIVATRAVVTKKFEEENIIIGGSPAKKIKQHVNWTRERIYNKQQ